MYIIVETFHNPGEPSSAKRRVRPLPGQGFSTELRVECSRTMRLSADVGSLFRLWVKLTDKEGGTPFLYSNPRDPWEQVTPAEAKALIAKAKF